MAQSVTTKAVLQIAGNIPAAPQIPAGAQRVTVNVQIPPGAGTGNPVTGPQQASGFITFEAPTTVPAAWAASTAYTLGEQILDSNGNVQQCTTAGTSGGSAPSWSEELGATTADGATLKWENAGTAPATLVPGPCTVTITQ